MMADRPARTEPTLLPYLYWLSSLLLLVPVWAARYFPTEDGPAHAYWIEVFRELGRPDSELHRYFVRSLHPQAPFHLLEFGLQYALAAVLDPMLAQKISISVVVLAWAGAIYFLAVSLARRVTIGAYAALLLLHGFFLYGGFVAFLGAIPLLLVTLALLVRLLEERPSNGHLEYALIALSGVVTYFAHLFVAGLFVLLCGLWLLTMKPAGRYARRRLALALMPTAALMLWYALVGTVGGGAIEWRPTVTNVSMFFEFEILRGLSPPKRSFSVLLAVLGIIVALLCWSTVRATLAGTLPPARRFVLVLTLVTAALYFAVPDLLGQAGNINTRLLLAMWAWLLPTLPYQMSSKTGAALVAMVGGLLLCQLGDLTLRVRRFSGDYAALLADVRAIPRGAVIESRLDYDLAGYQNSFSRVLAHLPEDLARRREGALPNSYFPLLGFYWVVQKPGVDVRPEVSIDFRQGPSRGISLDVRPTRDSLPRAHAASP